MTIMVSLDALLSVQNGRRNQKVVPARAHYGWITEAGRKKQPDYAKEIHVGAVKQK